LKKKKKKKSHEKLSQKGGIGFEKKNFLEKSSERKKVPESPWEGTTRREGRTRPH